MSNLKQLALAFNIYAQDYDESFPWGAWDNSSGALNAYPELHNPGSVVEAWWDWPYFVYPYVKNAQLFDCPTSPDPYPPKSSAAQSYDGNYVYNINGCYDFPKTLAAIEYPAETILVMDGGDAYLIPGADTMANLLNDLDLDWPTLTLERATRHNDMANVAYVDGHVKAVTRNYLLNVNQPPSNLPYNIHVY